MKCGVFRTRGGALVCPLTAFLLLYLPVTVTSQCERGDEGSCRWSNDETAGAKWVTETKSEESYIRLEKCRQQCLTGTILSPWLPPNTMPNQLVFYFKVYGYSEVYLKLEHKKENDNLPKTLFKKNANYGDDYPEKWSQAKVRVPPSDTSYQLMLKAYTPYSDGFIAVKGIAINEPNSTPSSTSSSTTSTSTSTTTTSRRVTTPSTTTTTTEDNDIDFPDEDGDPGDNSNEMSQPLEDRRFLSVEDFNFGRTTVVYPELCKY